MSAAWPWVILGRIPRIVSIPSDAEADEAAFKAADFPIRVARPPQVAAVTVGPLAHPDPNEPDKYPYVLAAGPDCLLLNFAVAPSTGVDSAVSAQDRAYLVVARGFRAGGGAQAQQQGHAAVPVGEPIPVRGRDDVAMPAGYKALRSVGLVASYDGRYTVAELVVYNGADRASLLRFRSGDDRWTRTDLSFPLAAEHSDWVPYGVVAQKETLWWFDLSWGLLSCDISVDDPVLLFHKLPEDRGLWTVHMPVQPDTHRCVTVSHRELRYVEIILEDRGGGGGSDKEAAAATVSMWTRRRIAADPAGWEWQKNYAVSFEKIWNDGTYKDTGLPRKVPVLSAVCPSNPDLVYFSLERWLFGVDVPKHKVMEVADEPHELVNLPFLQTPASCRYVHAWNVPPRVAKDLGLVGFSSSDEDEDQAEEMDEEELYKLGLEVAMGMDPSTLKSEVDKFFEGPKIPSPEREVMNQLRPPFSFCLTEKEADADLRKVDRLVKKRRLGD
ncbi:unnamed protein product [Urochloa decumbens]|uniref:DUF1618 domain-containing protein n=1 Tax=Urochloa decumbens TaxID=240449 RepID=A0ABC9E945_9POAL